MAETPVTMVPVFPGHHLGLFQGADFAADAAAELTAR